MNYKIIGNDGKIYGPASAAQIRAWIVQGRVESRTPVFVDGAADWTFVGLLPEFAVSFPAPPPLSPPAAVKTSSFAVTGFIFGLISLACCWTCPFNLFGLLGLIFSIIALVQISSSAEKQEGSAFAIAGLICSGVSLILSCGFGALKIFTPWHLFP